MKIGSKKVIYEAIKRPLSLYSSSVINFLLLLNLLKDLENLLLDIFFLVSNENKNNSKLISRSDFLFNEDNCLLTISIFCEDVEVTLIFSIHLILILKIEDV